MPSKGSERHTFSFDGGDKLTTIGATFFVSYLYYLNVDTSHRNWASIKTRRSRISTINNSENYYRAWLSHIQNMSDANLNRNSLGLEGQTIKKMAFVVQEKL
ncbi:hypothetical protein [Vibrio pectenicida]|uniref:Uncharacterized protein n=1 Tax=Vibrio pectenicida TaxID=62763 RepID=A0A3R9FQF6_9VIBR|nr:hypothetical protein [Vibrio pectenicida]RSD31925.1 hypothetical protein EJA03_06535 [Vibrio pectenicida]